MTAKEIFELRKQGHKEEAYEAARQLYSSDKSPQASTAMFWTAVDIFRQRMATGRTDEASKILQALERLLPNVHDKDGWVQDAFERCTQQLQKAVERQRNTNDLDEHTEMGLWGEEVAMDYLREKGYVILERDWHSKHRDIDIIALKDDTVVFVEVKTRRNTEFALPEQAVDWKKRRNLRHSISHYLKYRRIDRPFRLDIITVVGTLGIPHPSVNHIEDVDIM